MQSFEKLQKRIGYLGPDKLEMVHQAFLFAFNSHLGQKRESGEDYITHPLSVACVLADGMMDYQSIIVALLHDIIEDTFVTKEEIQSKFGEAVADLVDGVTKLTKIEFADKGEAQAQNFRKMMLAMSRDIRVILIKLADRLHNMRTIDSVSLKKAQRISRETLDIYAAIAHRLGMHEIRIELENLSFKVLYPRRYRVLNEAVERIYGENKEVMVLIEKELKDAFHRSSISDIKIVGRTKHLYGIYKKNDQS